MATPALHFATPRTLPNPLALDGRVAVLDIAFAAEGMGSSYQEVTEPFIRLLGSRLAMWVDHHDHNMHRHYADDSRFVLATKAQHGACPEMITPELVARAGRVDSLVVHLDLDGIYAAAKWIRGGQEPYPGADVDARCIDTRTGTPSVQAQAIDEALRGRFRDKALKRRIVHYLVGGLCDDTDLAAIVVAQQEFVAMAVETRRLAEQYRVIGRVAFCDASHAQGPYDKTGLLLRGQELAQVAAVQSSGMVTLAAPFNSGWNFLALLGLEGGMPTRVSVPINRTEDAISLINHASRR